VQPTFTDRELDIMAILWHRGPSTVAEVRERLSDRLAHNTVLTVLTVLEEKGYVDHTEEGKAHRFRARVKQETAGATAADRVVPTPAPRPIVNHDLQVRWSEWLTASSPGQRLAVSA